MARDLILSISESDFVFGVGFQARKRSNLDIQLELFLLLSSHCFRIFENIAHFFHKGDSLYCFESHNLILFVSFFNQMEENTALLVALGG